MKMVALIFGFAVLAWGGYQAFAFQKKLSTSADLVEKSEPFEYENENATTSIIFFGDSTAAGVGVDNPQNTTAGYFHEDFPEAQIVNKAVSGYKIADALETAQNTDDTYDLAVIQVGANDIIYQTDLENARRDLRKLFVEAKSLSENVVYLASGNIGDSSLFPFPVNWYYEHQSRKYLAVYENIAREQNVAFVDLFRENDEDLFPNGFENYEAADGLHLNAEGYRVWYDEIRKTMREENITLTN